MKIKEYLTNLKVTIENPNPETIKEDTAVLVKSCTDKTSKTGTLYKEFELSDDTGVIYAKMFYGKKTSSQSMAYLVPGNVAKVSLKGEIFNGKPSFIVDSCYGVVEDANPADYQPSILPDVEMMKKYLDSVITELRNDRDSRIILDHTICKDKETYQKFLVWPAAIAHHHACKYGLLMHTVEVIQNAVGIAERMNAENGPVQADIKLIKLAALLHDFGKLHEYKFDPDKEVIEMNDDCTRNGHIQFTTTLLSKIMTKREADKMASENPSFAKYVSAAGEDEFLDSDLFKERLIQIIASHHGKLEYGSLTTMQAYEDYIVNFADGISATLYSVRFALIGLSDGETSGKIFTLDNGVVWRP